MADMSSFTGVFRVQGPDDRRKVTKRNRQPVSCIPCRQKKLKCDRQQPCAACVKRGDTTSCEFGPASTVIPTNKTREKTRSEAQVRLQKLEEMVNGLIQSRSGPGSAEASQANKDMAERMKNLDVSSPLNKLRDSTGYYLSSQDTEASFVGPTHWIAILEGIHDLKDYLSNDPVASSVDILNVRPQMVHLAPDSDESPPSTSLIVPRGSKIKHDMILGPYEPISIESAIAALPDRSIVDKMLVMYFTDGFFASPFLHSKKFQRDYNAFREDPSGTPVMFISVLLSVLCVCSGMIVASGKLGQWPPGTVDPKKYMSLAGQVIVAGEYLKAQPFVIEALLLHCHSKFLRTVDSEPYLWSLAGLVVRLAQKLGMHRDPARLSQPISPFNAEMRRRMWFHVETFDLLMSFQLGMPPIINENECDVGHPRNILASDFDEDCVELPPERADTDHSPLLFYAYKSRFIRLFRRVIKHALSTTQPAYSETMAIDAEMQRLRSNMPARLRLAPIKDAPFTDTTADIVKRMMLEMLYLKSMVVLHRAFMTWEKDNILYAHSRDMAIDASLRMLDLQEEYHRETSPGGRMYEDRWMMSNLTMHDFLMAAMVICLDLSELPQRNQGIRNKKIRVLKTSYGIWNEKRGISRDADHAANVIGAMLAKVAAQDYRTSVNSNGGIDVITTFATPRGATSHSSLETGSAQTSSDVPLAIQLSSPKASQAQQSNSSTSNDESPFSDESFEIMDLDSLDEMLNNTDNFDWNLMDQYLRDAAPPPEAPGEFTLESMANGMC